MRLDGVLYLPGTVRVGRAGTSLERPEGRTPVADPEGVIDPEMDGTRRTLALAVTANRCRATDADPGIDVEGIHTVLIGRRRTRVTDWDERRSRTLADLTFSPGVWPVGAQSDDPGDASRARPIDECEERRPDRVRIDASTLAVVDVLPERADPFHGPLEELRVEFAPESERVRFTVPGLPTWADHGWIDCPPGEALRFLGRQLRESLGGASAEEDALRRTNLDLEYAESDGVARLRWEMVAHPVGVHPEGGLPVDRDTLVRSWIRDARAYLSVRSDADCRDLLETVADLAGVDPADSGPGASTASRSPLIDRETYAPGELAEVAREDDRRRRDAILALAERDERERIVALDEWLQTAEPAPADRWVLIEALGTVESTASARHLLSAVRSDPREALRDHAEAAAESLSSAVLADAVVDLEPERSSGVEGLVEALDDPEPRVRALAAQVLPELAGEDLAEDLVEEDVAEDLVERLVEEGDRSVRRRLADAVETLDEDLAEAAAVDRIRRACDADDRAALLELSRYGGLPSRERLLDGLQSRRTSLQMVAADTAGEFDEDPPYEALVALLDESVDRLVRKRAASSVQSLAERAGSLPPADPLLDALEDRDHGSVQGPAFETLETMARAYDGGDFYGVDPATALADLAEAPTDFMRPYNDRMARTLTEFLAPLDHEAALADLAGDPDTKEYLAYMLGREGDRRSGPALLALSRDDEGDVRWKALRALQKVPGAVAPDDVDGDPGENNRLLMLYQRVAASAHEEDDDRRLREALDGLLALTERDDWRSRAKAVETLQPFLSAEPAFERVLELAREDPHSTVRRIAVHLLWVCEDRQVRELYVETVADESQPEAIREAACRGLERWTNGPREDGGEERSGRSLDEATARRLLDSLPAASPPLWEAIVETVAPAVHDEESGEDLVEAFLDRLDETAREGGNPGPRENALNLLPQLRETNPEVVDVSRLVDALTAVLDDPGATDRLREVARTNLLHLQHRAAFDALDRCERSG